MSEALITWFRIMSMQMRETITMIEFIIDN